MSSGGRKFEKSVLKPVADVLLLVSTTEAVEWLNNHTDDKIGFFLCEIKLFQIGDSDIAPSFTVVERPNDWTKEIKKTTLTNPTQQQRLEYWNAFNDYAFQNAEFAKSFNKRKPNTDHWIQLLLDLEKLKMK